MTIKKLISKSNTLILLLSLIALLLIGSLVLRLFEDTYIQTIIPNEKLQESAYEIQKVLNEYQLIDNQFTKDDINRLENEVSNFGYRLYVSKEEETLFTSLLPEQQETAMKLSSSLLNLNKSMVYIWDENTLIGKLIDDTQNQFRVIAMHSNDELEFSNLNRITFENLILSFLIVGVGAILVIVLISRIFTHKLVHKIMLPMNKLIEGAKRIESGNLDGKIIYEGEEEFELVCKSFNAMQENLRYGIDKNKAYEKARTELVSGISHDLRTPLTSVKGYIKGLIDGVAKSPERQKQYLDIAYKKACDMDILLQKLFYFSKLETVNMPLNLTRVDMKQFLENYVTKNENYIKGEQGEISLDILGTHYFANIDKEQFYRVMDNIIGNSIKYRTENPVEIRLSLEETEESIVIEIQDNGLGVDEEKLIHLFEQFYRGDESRNTKNEGSGLGLYISKFIIEQHNGRITAYNKNGLCIKIELPKVTSI